MKVWMCWSGGKDSAYALETIRANPQYRITALLTTLSAEFDRVSMHGVRRTLLEAQAAALGLPLETVFLQTPPRDASCEIANAASGMTIFASNGSYEEAMLAAFARARAAGVEAIVFGDIYLQDLRSYREQLLARAGLQGLFPLWNRDSAGLARAIADAGIRATVVCVDGQRLDASHCGREFNPQFVAALPAGVDPCGERGEYHSFVHAMPAFSRPIEVVAGEKVWRDPFWFCDLLPAQAQAAAA